jgi:predicted metal-binding membrane protein
MAATASLPEGATSLLRRFLRSHPETYAAGFVALAWLAFLSVHAQAASHAQPGMLGMDMAGLQAHGWRAAALELPGWELMVLAMMGPALLPGLRHVYTNSLTWRRKRAMVEFASTYFLVWGVFGFVALGGVHVLPGASTKTLLIAALALAALWELTASKRSALRDCHQTIPLPPSGFTAEVAAARFGLRHGLACLRSCWPLMLIMALLPLGQLWWMVGLSVLVSCERFVDRPRRVTRLAAAALAVGAIGLSLLTLL